MSTRTVNAMSSELSYDLQARDQFARLPQDQQRDAIRRLAAVGHSDHTISAATGLDVSFVRRLLADPSLRPARGER